MADTASTATEQQVNANEEFPESIRISGLPFMLQGWNGVYHKVEDELSDGAPMYRLDPYVLYWVIPILGVTFRRTDGKWYLVRDHEDIMASNRNLLGVWGYFSMKVSAA